MRRLLGITLVFVAVGCLAQAAPAPPASPASPALTAPAFSTGNRQIQFSSTDSGIVPTSVSPAFECMTDSTHSNQSWHSSDGGEMHWSVSIAGNGCSVDLRAEGVITFTHDGFGLAAIERGGYFEISDRTPQSTRRLEAKPGSAGVEYKYSVDGTAHDFDAAGRAWLASFLLGLERRSGYAAEVRVASLLEQGGPNAVLNEISKLRGDYVRGRYYSRLFDSAKLDPATVRRVLEQAKADINSDYELARVLIAVSDRYELADETSRLAFLQTTDKLKSDYERARVLLQLLKRPNLSPATLNAALQATARLKSDYERARVLINLPARFLDDANLDTYLDAVAGIHSDYERGRTYIALLENHKLEDRTLVKLLGSVGSMRSDYELARVLVAVAARYKLEGEVRNAYLRAADQIRSDYERQRALANVVHRTTV